MGKYGDNILIDISALGFKGEGIANIEGKTVFVPFALPDEKVSAKVVYQKGDLVFAHAKKIVVKSADRVEAACPVFGQCGGCDLQHMRYENQLELKREIVRRNIKKIADIDIDIAPVVKSPLQYGYRNKLVMPLSEREGETVIGFYKEGTNEIVDTVTCPLHGAWADKAILTLREFMAKYKVEPYIAAEKRGLVRHLIARKIGEKLIVTVVVFGDGLPYKEKLYEMLKGALNSVTLFININKKEGNSVTGEKYIFAGGVEDLTVDIDGLSVNIHPAAFFQVNDGIRELLYKDIAALCSEKQGGILIDAYSGAGVLTALLSRHFDRAYGIDIVPQAVDAANDLMKRNNITNVQNTLGDCGDVLPRLFAWELKNLKNCTVVLDPPRKGCDQSIIVPLLKFLPEKIIYISCNSATLARDLARLGLNSQNPPYKILSTTPYDMFPQTRHVETMVLMEKIKE